MVLQEALGLVVFLSQIVVMEVWFWVLGVFGGFRFGLWENQMVA